MTKAKSEKPQKKNPHKLVLNQHVLPLTSIARFVGSNGYDPMFCAFLFMTKRGIKSDRLSLMRRAWDQRAEAGYMKDIEDAFQAIASKIIDGTVSTINAAENIIVNRFYALWYIRARLRTLDTQEIQLNKVTGRNLTQDEEERLEKNGILFIREGGKVPARQMNGIQIQRWIDAYTSDSLSAATWGIIQAQEGQFIVPDVSAHIIIPLTPTICLAANTPDGIIVMMLFARPRQRTHSGVRGGSQIAGRCTARPPRPGTSKRIGRRA
jgi:hypothetical protein